MALISAKFLLRKSLWGSFCAAVLTGTLNGFNAHRYLPESELVFCPNIVFTSLPGISLQKCAPADPVLMHTSSLEHMPLQFCSSPPSPHWVWRTRNSILVDNWHSPTASCGLNWSPPLQDSSLFLCFELHKYGNFVLPEETRVFGSTKSPLVFRIQRCFSPTLQE